MRTAKAFIAFATSQPLAIRVARAIAAAMKILPRIIAIATLLLGAPAGAIVGGGAPSTDGIGRSVVTIIGSRGNFCSGALIAPQLVLTVAHCVQPGATYKIVEYGADRQPLLQDVKRVAIHPAFNMQAMLAHRATADVALLQLEAPARGKKSGAARHAQNSDGRRQPLHHRRHRRHHPRRGKERRHRSRRRPGRDRPSREACRSGWSIRSGKVRGTGSAPVPEIPAGRCSRISQAAPSSSASSAGRPGRTAAAGCGGLTGVTPLTLYRDWIVQTAGRVGLCALSRSRLRLPPLTAMFRTRR